MASKSGKLVHNGTVIKDFVLVENPADLESVLTSRLPVSANVSFNYIINIMLPCIINYFFSCES